MTRWIREHNQQRKVTDEAVELCVHLVSLDSHCSECEAEDKSFFYEQQPVEIKLEELEKIVRTEYFIDGATIKIHRGLSNEIIRHLMRREQRIDWLPQIVDIKSEFIAMDAKLLLELVTAVGVGPKFKIMFKELTPGDTTIAYDIWVEFEKESNANVEESTHQTS